MANLTSVQRLLVNAKDRKEIPVLSAIRNDPDMAAVGTKLMEDPHSPKRYDNNNNLTIDAPMISSLRSKAEQGISRQQEAENLIAVLPDIELIKQILISSILAPKDWVTTELSYDIAPDIFKPDLRAKILNRIKNYFDNTYKIKDLLYRICEDVFFYTGSYPIVVLPENAIDDLINGSSNYSMESFRDVLSKEFLENGSMRPLGLLGGPDTGKVKAPNPVSASLESILRYRDIPHQRGIDNRITFSGENNNEVIDTHIRVTDNYNLLKRPKIEQVVTETIQSDILNKSHHPTMPSFESHDEFNLSDRDIVGLLYQARNTSNAPIRVIRTQDQLKRHSVTDSLIQHYPSISIIPVCKPGNENEHVGYFAINDENGNPITEHTYRGGLGRLLENNKGTPFGRSIISRAAKGLSGRNDQISCGNPAHVNEMVKTYMNIVEADLMARLRNGIYSSSYKIASNQEIYRIMLARSLAGNATQILWIPKELMTYFAVDYDNDGVGVSLLHRNAVVGAMRSGLLFADVRAAIRNSVGTTIVEINMDEDDHDQEKRLEQVIGQFMTTRQEAVPWTAMPPMDTADFIARAGVEFKITGSSQLPNMEISKNETNSNYVRPDGDMQELLLKQFSMGFGITSDILDNIHQPEHATTVINRNILLTKRVMQHQEKLNPLVTDNCRKVARYSADLIGELTELIEAEFEGIVLTDKLKEIATKSESARKRIITITIRDMLDTLDVALPAPDTVTMENQVQELTNYETALDARLNAYFESNLFDAELVGDLSNKIDDVRAVVKSHFMRQEMNRLGLCTEVAELFGDAEDSLQMDQLYDEHSQLVKGVLVGFGKYVSSMQEFKAQSDKASEALGLEEGAVGGGDYSSSDTDDSSSDGDDFGGDDPDLSSFDEPGDDFAEDAPPGDDLGDELGEDAPLEA